jgi:hypothetical protein
VLPHPRAEPPEIQEDGRVATTYCGNQTLDHEEGTFYSGSWEEDFPLEECHDGHGEGAESTAWQLTFAARGAGGKLSKAIVDTVTVQSHWLWEYVGYTSAKLTSLGVVLL